MRPHICWGNYEARTHDSRETSIWPSRPVRRLFASRPPIRATITNGDLADIDIPDDKILIPGVIDSTTNFVEHPRLVAQRIGRYAGVIDRERLIAGVDCGFGTAVRSDPMVVDSIVWAKLRALSEGAAIASKRLWGNGRG
jgi:5-methyltetrahydropteroyltriglutamate--homocysteine methyltransferase